MSGRRDWLIVVGVGAAGAGVLRLATHEEPVRYLDAVRRAPDVRAQLVDLLSPWDPSDPAAPWFGSTFVQRHGPMFEGAPVNAVIAAVRASSPEVGLDLGALAPPARDFVRRLLTAMFAEPLVLTRLRGEEAEGSCGDPRRHTRSPSELGIDR